MKYILDTNTLSFLMAGDASVSERLLALARTDVLVPQPVIAEIEYGLARLPKSRKRDRLRRRFHVFSTELQRVPWTDDVSRTFGQVKAFLESQGTPLEDFDVAVASHALSRDATLVTDNLDHMQRISDLRIENWRYRSDAN